MRAILTRLQSSHSNLRTDVIEGETHQMPEVGKPFLLIGAPLDIKEVDYRRYVCTSPIVHIAWEDLSKCRLHTENSIYSLELDWLTYQEG